MKKVGILTFHRATNYGALLQAYSLIIKLKNDYPNISFELVDYSTMVASIDHFKTVVKPLLSGNLKASYAEFNKNRILSKFSESLPRSKKRILSDKIEKISAYINNTYDAIIVGSDAVFSWRNKVFPTIYLLKDVKKPIKLSYAASAHGLHYKNASKDIISYCNEAFSSFDYLGVRDNETEKLVKYCAPHVKLHHNCDPTIFFDLESIRNEKNNVCKKLSKLKLDKNKPLMLIMSPDEKIGNYIVREYSKHYNIVSLFIPNKAIDKSIMNLTPFEWANVFSFAQFVVTEYFHGTIFSLKNGIPTLSIDKTSANSGYEGKIKDLLVRRLQLPEIYLNIDDICLEGYDIIKNRIENISRNFCKNSVFNAIIEEGKEYDTFTHSFEALLLK